jgi:hypothetical protein
MEDLGIVFAQDAYGIFHLAEHSVVVGVHIKDCSLGSRHGRKSWPTTGSQHMADLPSEFQDHTQMRLTVMAFYVTRCVRQECCLLTVF